MSSFDQNNQPQVYAPIAQPHQAGRDAASLLEEYRAQHALSVSDPAAFWDTHAQKLISWFAPYTRVSSGDFTDGDIAWFLNGKLNVAFNCIDRHLPDKADKVAIIWEGDEIGENRYITYAELSKEVQRIANVFKSKGVKKGDVVTIYMPMVPEVAYTMLACARIGAVHSVVFAGFSSDSLRDRILDCHSGFVVTSNVGRRGGRTLSLKSVVDHAVERCVDVKHVFVFTYPGTETPHLTAKDVNMTEALKKVRAVCPCEWMDSEDPLFVLYTSGSTGKPKGVAHTTAGYILNATLTTQNTFALGDKDVYACVADAGWITGHTYIVYGPLSAGATTTMFESVPTHPHPYRYWDLVQKHRITQFYTAPTAIRALMRYDASRIAEYDLSSLRILGSVGEPINPEAWKWYYTHVGREKCTIVDTYWQTETGAHIATNLPGVIPMKPGSCTLPCYGIDLLLIDPATGKEVPAVAGEESEGVLCVRSPWPSIARTVHGDHDRYLNVYLRPYPGLYFTGDGARRDKDGFFWITGRVDDVINPSGHRLGTAEIESALVACPQVAEAAVVGFPHEVKGEGIGCFVILRDGVEISPQLTTILRNSVREAIGPIATPDFIVYGDLPKTRSGKIMRRILRKVAHGESDSIGDTSTLADPTVVQRLIERFKEAYHSGANHTCK